MDRSRLDVRLLIASLAVAVTLGLGALAQAQAPPRAPGLDVTSSNGPFTDEQRAAIKAFAEFWAGKIADRKSAPEDVEKARGELLGPLERLKNPSPAFRFEYSGFVVPVLEPVLKNGQLHSAINAARVMGELGSSKALSALLSATEAGAGADRWQVRLQAANGVRSNLQSGTLDARSVTDAVRRLVASTGNENNNLILRYKFEALAAADQDALSPELRQDARLKLVDAIKAAVKQIAANPQSPSPMMDAVRVAVVKLRNVYIGGKLAVPEQKQLGERLGPVLGEVLVIANNHWQAAQADEQTARLYGNFVQVCEEFLKRIDGFVRGPDQSPKTQLQSAWTGKKKEQFDTDAKQWNDVLSKAPYQKP